MSVRELPASLLADLRRVRALEAGGLLPHQARQAMRATNVLMLAAVEAGWTRGEIANALGMNRNAVQNRVVEARARLGSQPPALVVDHPLDKPPPRSSALALPLAQREWLTIGEAGDFAGVSRSAIRLWRLRGMLPHTDQATPSLYLYLRADLERIMSAPRRNNGVDHTAVMTAVEDG